MGHVILKEFHIDRTTPYCADYARRYTDMPFLVRLDKRGDAFVPGRFLRASDFAEGLGQANNPDWKKVGMAEASNEVVVPTGTNGFRWGGSGKGKRQHKAGAGGAEFEQIGRATCREERRQSV